MNTVQGGLGIMRAEWRVGALQFIALPVLALLFGAWLWIKEATRWELALQVVIAGFICFAAVWLQAATMRRYRRAEPRPHWLPVFLWCVVFAALMYWVASWSDNFAKLAPYLYSKMSHGMRETLGFKNVGRFFAFAQAAVFWWVVPVLMLPFGVEWASAGVLRAEYRRCFRMLGSRRYWLSMAVPAVVAAWVPGLLVDWKPGKGLAVQIMSAILRIGLVYAIALMCWLFAIAVAAWSLREQGAVVRSAAERVGGDPAAQPA
jgi:hypothetical protein